MNPNKRIGIVVDDYKVERYMDEIKKLGLEPSIKMGITTTTKTITIDVPSSQYPDEMERIRRLCKRLEHTKKQNDN